jgi:hypothetical protein
MQQNSLYYRQYYDLRLDKYWRLISYFYYIKYAKSRDRIAFRHINQNISFLLTIKREANMIQNFLSLNDENVNNCIIVLSEMHKHLTSWWERVTIKELTTNEWIHRIIDFMFTKQNTENFDISWTNVLERREDIRVILSTLLYETNESIILIRRIMLSWYVNILNDHESIKNMKIETWIELIAIHRDLIVVRTFSFDLLNKYDAISYKFSTAMKVIDLESLSDALVKRKRWDTSTILTERDLWLKEDSNYVQFQNRLCRWRRRAFYETLTMFQHVKRAEKNAFESKSFFRLKRKANDNFIFFIINDVDLRKNSDHDEMYIFWLMFVWLLDSRCQK